MLAKFIVMVGETEMNDVIVNVYLLQPKDAKLGRLTAINHNISNFQGNNFGREQFYS